MPLADCPTRLAEAREALHELSMGRAVVEVSNGPRRTKYSAANRGDLESYLRQLEAECGGPGGAADCAKRRRPIGVTF